MKASSVPLKVTARLVLLGFVASLLILTGCASAPSQPIADQYNYINATGYPAVGLRNWNL